MFALGGFAARAVGARRGVSAALSTASQSEEAAVRQDLVLAHRLCVEYGMDELVWNHCSARFGDQPVQGSRFLVTPGNRHFADIEAEDMCAVVDLGGGAAPPGQSALENETGDVIHSAIYSARNDVGAVVHTHTPHIAAVACLKEGLKCYDQSSALFYNDVAYYDWQGVSTDHDERADLAEAVSGGTKKNACTMGKTISEAWVRMYYLDRCCRLQLELMKSGGEINVASDKVMAATKESLDGDFAPGEHEWEPLRRWMARAGKM
eukprot:gene16430-9967_t